MEHLKIRQATGGKCRSNSHYSEAQMMAADHILIIDVRLVLLKGAESLMFNAHRYIRWAAVCRLRRGGGCYRDIFDTYPQPLGSQGSASTGAPRASTVCAAATSLWRNKKVQRTCSTHTNLNPVPSTCGAMDSPPTCLLRSVSACRPRDSKRQRFSKQTSPRKTAGLCKRDFVRNA